MSSLDPQAEEPVYGSALVDDDGPAVEMDKGGGNQNE